MTRIAFSVAARDDRRAITAYTAERFGIHQARRLRATFERVLNTLTDTPMIGRTRHELDPPGRNFRYFVMMKLFVIVYEPTPSGIRVARILHALSSPTGAEAAAPMRAHLPDEIARELRRSTGIDQEALRALKQQLEGSEGGKEAD